MEVLSEALPPRVFDPAPAPAPAPAPLPSFALAPARAPAPVRELASPPLLPLWLPVRTPPERELSELPRLAIVLISSRFLISQNFNDRWSNKTG